MARLRNLWHSIFSVADLAARHRCSGYNSAYRSDARSVEEYLAEWRDKVAAARTDLDGPRAQHIIEGNSPFVLKPDTPERPQRGILMVHGLSDSAFLVREIGEFFRQQGFYVFAMLLPGHGTRPGDLLEIRWQDWLQAHQRGGLSDAVSQARRHRYRGQRDLPGYHDLGGAEYPVRGLRADGLRRCAGREFLRHGGTVPDTTAG